MNQALRRAAWGLTAGLMLAGPALAQYAAHLPGQNAPAPYTTASGTAAFQIISVPTPTVSTVANTTYITPYTKPTPAKTPITPVVEPVAHMTSVSAITAMPATYVLQAVDGEPITTPVLDSHTKLEEMKVELALLADPATFACNLSAKLDGSAMLVRGFVPNDQVRERAIEIARTGTHLTVADGLKLHRTLAMRAAGVPVATLRQAASDLLGEDFPETGTGIEIKATITGQITLTGAARSYEEKLAISRRLRRLNGCTSVVNQLKVTPVVKDGTSLTMVTADGLHVVPSEVATDEPMQGMVQAIPAVRVVAPVQGTATMNSHDLPPLPSNPDVMEARPMVRSLPTALPAVRSKAASSVSQGVVDFGDEPVEKTMRKK